MASELTPLVLYPLAHVIDVCNVLISQLYTHHKTRLSFTHVRLCARVSLLLHTATAMENWV